MNKDEKIITQEQDFSEEALEELSNGKGDEDDE